MTHTSVKFTCTCHVLNIFYICRIFTSYIHEGYFMPFCHLSVHSFLCYRMRVSIYVLPFAVSHFYGRKPCRYKYTEHYCEENFSLLSYMSNMLQTSTSM